MGLEERKKFVWVTRSSRKHKKRSKRLPLIVGGALCIHPSGLLLTTVISTCPSLKRDEDVSKYKVEASNTGSVFFKLSLVRSFLVYGVLLYQIEKNNDSDEFDYIDLESVGKIEFEVGDKAYSYIHECGLEFAFSHATGFNGFPVPPFNLTLPDHTQSLSTFHSASPEDVNSIKDESIHKTASYRTIGDVIDPISEPKPPSETLSMCMDLPLLQVSGLGLHTYFGQSGCPVFSSVGDSLLGLILFATGSFSFVLPVSVLLYCYRVVKPSWKRKSESESESEVGSCPRKETDSDCGGKGKGGGGRRRSFDARGPAQHVTS